MVCRPLWWAPPPSWWKDYALPSAPSIGKSLHFALGQTGKPEGNVGRDKRPEYPGVGLYEPTLGFIEQGEEEWRMTGTAIRMRPFTRQHLIPLDQIERVADCLE